MFFRFAIVLFAFSPGGSAAVAQNPSIKWQLVESQRFTLYYTAADSAVVPLLSETLLSGISGNEAFFGWPYPRHFDVWCFPGRAALDRQWQHDWGDSTFQSACWMVASGVAHRLDLLSPRVWDTQACEHRYPLAPADSAGSPQHQKAVIDFRQLITHELTHVYHGQHCRIPDFTGMDDLGWWVEGLATFVSGQLDSSRLERVRALLREGKAPAKLSEFWSGPNRYGLSGSVVAALDARFGRVTLLRLLPGSTPAELFGELRLEEGEVLRIWEAFVR